MVVLGFIVFLLIAARVAMQMSRPINYNAYPVTAADTARVSTPVPAAPQSEPTWHQIARWRGTGMKETETFVTSSREWRITWKTANERVAGILQIYVKNEAGEMITLAANAMGEKSDVSYVRSPPGRHYLQINSANIDWVLTVEDKR